MGGLLGTMTLHFDSFQHTSYKAGGYSLVGSNTTNSTCIRIGNDTQSSGVSWTFRIWYTGIGRYVSGGPPALADPGVLR